MNIIHLTLMRYWEQKRQQTVGQRGLQQLVAGAIALGVMATLMRMQVHYRAPPDARGSGKERGHGCELQQCPKCEKELKQGRHHVGCFANKGSNTKKRPQKVLHITLY